MDERRSEDLDHLYRALAENTRACARSLERLEANAHARQGWSWSRFGANAATALIWVASGAVAAWGVWCVVVALFGGVFPLPFVHLEVVEGSIL
ncbi:MAG TPA: hypothetical protein VFE45_18355, partial [Coriobacteriia bacterium]|nr:hypothetical protein [Coriobacteriia bacterium]